MNFLKKIALPTLLLLSGLYLVPISIFEHDFSKIPGDLGDARFNNYILEHGHKYITGDIDSYWNAPFMYPTQKVVTHSDNLLGTLPIYSFFRGINFDRETSYQLWLLVLFALNFVCCFWALNRWSRNSILSSVGAYIFAFSILLVGNIYNVQTMPRFMVPILFYWTWQYFKLKDIKYLLGITLGLVYQFYCGIYLGFLMFYVLLFFFISYVLTHRDISFFTQFKKGSVLLKSSGVILVSLLILMPLMLPYYENSQAHGVRTFKEMISTIPTLRSYFFTSEAPVFWQFLSSHGIGKLQDWWCHFLFLGGLPWLAIIISPFLLLSKKVEKEQKKMISFLLVGLGLSMFFILNINGWSAYEYVSFLPGFSSMRSINRIINTEVVFFILIVVFVFKELATMNKNLKWIIYILPIVVVADNLIYPDKIIRYDKIESQERVTEVKKKIVLQNTKNLSVIAYLPSKYLTDHVLHSHIDAMLASQELGLTCVNAYTGSFPQGYGSFYENMTAHSLTGWLKKSDVEQEAVAKISGLGKIEKARKTLAFQSVFNQKYLCADKSLDYQLIVNRDKPFVWETFEIIYFEDNQVSLLSDENRLMSTIDNSINVQASSNDFSHNQLFKMRIFGGDTVVFQTSQGKYLSVDDQSLYLVSNADSIGESEKFIVIPIESNSN